MTARLARILCVALALFMPATALAQLDTGTIVGRVTDPSGAVLPGVLVTLTQDATGVSATTVTNASGEYVFPGQRIGRYTVAAELEGFKKASYLDVELNVQARLQLDFELGVGALSEQVTVTGRAPLLQTQSADIGNVVDQRQIQDLPLLGRRYAELAYLTPGVVAAPAGISSRGEDSFFNANGNYATWNNYTLDGADNNSFSTNLQERSPQVVQPPIDALAEFKVQTRTYSAEFGKAAGAVINASIKQGTNRFRGSGFEFFRDEAFNANTWDNNRAGRPKGAFNQHIAGFTLGGPVLRNKTFFFGDYQATRSERALSQTATVPTARMRTGDLSELTGAIVASNPFVAAGCVDAVNRRINPACIDPVAARLVNLYPLPNVPGAGFFNNNFISNGTLNNDINQFDLRVDHNLSPRDNLFVRYSFQQTDRVEPPVLDDPVASGDFASRYLIRGQNAVGGWSRIFGASVFSEFRAGYNRVRSDAVHPSFGIDSNAEYGIKGVPTDPRFYGGLPHMPIARFTRLGGPFFRPQFQTSQVFQFSENLTWTVGRHSMKFGLERRRDLVTYIDLRSLNGELGFSDGRYTGLGLGDFLLGLSSTQRLTLFHQPDMYADGWQVYAQDSWRLRDNLTVNAGIRYERFTPLFDRSNKLTNIDPATGQVFTAKDGSIFDRALVRPDTNDIAPRVGIVWTPVERLALRGGVGIFYQQFDRYGSESQLGLNLPQLVDASITANTGNDAPAFTFAQGLHAAECADHQPGHRAVAHPGPESEHADRLPVQRRPRVSVEQHHGGGRRIRGQPHAQRPAPAQSEPGHHPAEWHGGVPLRAVRLRQRLSRADRDQRSRRLRLAADADAEAHVGRARLHARLHVEQGDGRLPRPPERGWRRQRQLSAGCLQHGGRLRPAGLRHPAPLRGERHLRAAVRSGPHVPRQRRRGGDSRRLVGQRHPHAERWPSLHGDGGGYGGHRLRPHHARQLRGQPQS